ncbi:MAG TPA: hypothetical protein VNE39_05330 [Planctomycetota bacterium]|nr:hypothetical protein [Planctomycetota bacterium]
MAALALAAGLLCAATRAGEDELATGFRNPPAACRPAEGWFLSKAFAETVAKCPDEFRGAFQVALADGGLSTTPEEVKRVTTWQALADPALITSAKPDAKPPTQPYAAVAKGLGDFAARIVFLCSKTTGEGGVFTQAKAAHGITIYPPPAEPVLFLVRRKLGEADFYLVTSQAHIDLVFTITFPRVAEPEIWDPEDGSIAPALTYDVTEKTTMLNLRLPPYGAVFVVLRKPPTKQHVVFAPALQATAVEPDGSAVTGLARTNGLCSVMFTGQRMKSTMVRDLPPPLPIATGWTMKTQQPAKRLGVGIVALKIKRPSVEEEKAGKLAAPDLDDSDWQAIEIGKPQPVAAVGGAEWQANWLGMHGNNEERLFRKTFDLPEEPDLATATITGDNGYELFVNGEKAGADGNWNEAETYNIKKLLHKGSNAFAVHLTNQGDVGALLLESRIRLASGRLIRVVTDATWKMAEKAPDGWQKPDFDDKAWGKVDVIGKPPIRPWGEVPGLPPDPEAAESIWCRFTLPAGAKSVTVPAGAKEPKLFVDGQEAPLKDGVADLSASVQNKPRVAALRTLGVGTLDKPILCECSESAVGVGSWLFVGYPTYSGLADYMVSLDLPDAYRKERLFLDLGEVGCVAQVSVNGKDLGARLWPPHLFDITDALKPGANAVKIAVANTAANSLGRDLPADRLAAGLIGPVRIVCKRLVSIKAD